MVVKHQLHSSFSNILDNRVDLIWLFLALSKGNISFDTRTLTLSDIHVLQGVL
jgi:hypothetical protein